MKSPALPHSTESLDFHLLQRTSNFQIANKNKVKRRASRKNLMVFTVLYAMSVALVFYMFVS